MQTIELEKVNFGIAEDGIDVLREEYMPLTIQGVDDKEGFEVVHQARMDVKKRRVAIEKARKGLNADAQAYIRTVNGEAKRLMGLLEPIETHLIEEEESYKAEKERIAREEEERRESALRKRLDALTECGCLMNPRDVEAMSADEFANVLEIKRAEFEAQQREQEVKEKRDRLARTQYDMLRKVDCLVAIDQLPMPDADFNAAIEKGIAEQRRRAEAKAAEEKRLADERAALEAQRKEQEQREAELRAERDRLAREEAERKRLAEIEQAKRAAEECARREAEERRQREEIERRQREEIEAEKKRAYEAAKPDRQRLEGVASQIEQIVIPNLKNQKAAKTAADIRDRAAADIRIVASELGIVVA